MFFSQTSEYALRAMACLTHARGAVLKSNELAEQAQIPGHYVSKVMRQLVLAELVEARRGHHGGFRLARPPSDITFTQILTAMGDAPATERCVFGLPLCDHDNPCSLHPAWMRLKGELQAWADSSRLSDVLDETEP